MGKTQIEEYIKQYIVRLKSDLPSCKVILYGSFLNDQYKRGESDIDLIVIDKKFKKMSEDDRFDLLYGKTVGLPLDWHIYGFAPEEVKSISPLNTLSEALRNGKVIKS